MKEEPMSVETLIVWIVIGAIAGLLADRVVKGVTLSLGGAILVGIIGAFVGGGCWASLIFPGLGLVSAIVTAFIGAVVMLVLVRAVRA
jgi:uncharacterized membrane protein YeaQ/YmgE (transglycosylase-associated protein family)